MAAVLPTSAEVISGTQTMAEQKVDFASMLDFLAENINKGTTGGTSTAYTAALVPPIAALEARQRHRLKIHVASGVSPTLAVDGLAAAAIKAYDGTGAKVAAVLSLDMLADLEYDGTDYVLLNPLPVGGSAIQGAHKNLRSSATGASAVIVITADQITVETTGNECVTLRTVNLALNTAGAGANGLDTGVLAASTIYHKWIIYNPTTATTAALLSLSSTAPTMPAGYTYKARVGAIPTDATGNKYPLGHVSFGADTDLIVKAATNVTARPKLISGVQGSVGTPTWASGSMAAYVPSTASRVRGNVGAIGGAAFAMIFAPNNQYGQVGSSANPPPVCFNTSGTSVNVPFDFAIESTNVYYACDNANGFACLGGWMDTI